MSPPLKNPRLLLVGNYPPDGQWSMLRFGDLLRKELLQAGLQVEFLQPLPVLRCLADQAANPHGGWTKWLGYADKFVLFPFRLWWAARRSDLVHVCDHSNAMYGRWTAGRPWLVTCHDLLAVRGARGDVTAFCPASATGRLLQHWILAGVRQAPWLACDSQTTQRDVERLTGRQGDGIHTVLLPLNSPFVSLSREQVWQNLPHAVRDLGVAPYLLMVGSAQPRKNREAALRVLARLRTDWPGFLVVAGAPLADSQQRLAADLGVQERVVEVPGPDHAALNALYCGAHALLFPSYAEGFGWPLIEAQASGCPVICSDRTSIPEVAGKGALVFDAEDVDGMAQAVLRLQQEPELRQELLGLGEQNLARFQMEPFVQGYLNLYQKALAAFRS